MSRELQGVTSLLQGRERKEQVRVRVRGQAERLSLRQQSGLSVLIASDLDKQVSVTDVTLQAVSLPEQAEASAAAWDSFLLPTDSGSAANDTERLTVSG